MDRERAKELLPIIQAFAEGKQIQVNNRIMRDDSLNKWYDTDDITGKGEYRIKPEPRIWYILIPDGYGAAVGCEPVPTVVKDGDYAKYAGTVIKVREVLDGD